MRDKDVYLGHYKMHNHYFTLDSYPCRFNFYPLKLHEEQGISDYGSLVCAGLKKKNLGKLTNIIVNLNLINEFCIDNNLH